MTIGAELNFNNSNTHSSEDDQTLIGYLVGRLFNKIHGYHGRKFHPTILLKLLFRQVKALILDTKPIVKFF